MRIRIYSWIGILNLKKDLFMNKKNPIFSSTLTLPLKLAIFTFAVITLSSPTLKAYFDVEKVTIEGVDNVYRIKGKNGEIYSSSQPSQEAIASIAKQGIKMMVNLRTEKEMTFDERAVAKKNNLRYFHVPVTPETIDEKMVRKLGLLVKHSPYPLYFHCSSANRVATILALHDIYENKVEVEAAIKKAETYGLTKDELKVLVRKVAAGFKK